MQWFQKTNKNAKPQFPKIKAQTVRIRWFQKTNKNTKPQFLRIKAQTVRIQWFQKRNKNAKSAINEKLTAEHPIVTPLCTHVLPVDNLMMERRPFKPPTPYHKEGCGSLCTIKSRRSPFSIN